MPDSVTEIGYLAFDGCTALEAFYGKYATSDNRAIIFNGELLAVAPVGITDYTVPADVTSIGGNAFLCSTSLSSVTIPDSVVAIGGGAFGGCTSMKAFYGKYATQDNRFLVSNGKLLAFAPAGLSECVVPEGVKELGWGAFLGFDSLTGITLPATLTKVGSIVFYNCTGLAKVYCKPATPQTLDYDAFNTASPDIKIYVPRASVDTYKSATGWKSYATKINGYDF